MCVDIAFHDKNDGNPHVHILMTMRPLTEDGKWGDKSRLEYVLDADGNRIPARQKGRWKTRKISTTDWDERGNVERWRTDAADAINNDPPAKPGDRPLTKSSAVFSYEQKARETGSYVE